MYVHPTNESCFLANIAHELGRKVILKELKSHVLFQRKGDAYRSQLHPLSYGIVFAEFKVYALNYHFWPFVIDAPVTQSSTDKDVQTDIVTFTVYETELATGKL